MGHEQHGATVRCLTFGDSIAGYVSTPLTIGLANRGHINAVVANPGSGLTGLNTNGFSWEQELPAYLDDFRPDFVVVILGTNDAGRRVTNPVYQDAMKRLIRIIANRQIYWCNVADKEWNRFWLPDGAPHQNWALDDLTRQYPHLHRVDVKSALYWQSDFIFDGLHPSGGGAQKYANAILAQLR